MVETGSQRKKRQQRNDDRISDLSNDVLILILSFLNGKEAVQTCILSKRWINLWKTLPTLTLSRCQFSTFESFDQFLSMFLSLRDHSIDIRALLLPDILMIKYSIYLKVIEYAFSHNVQHFQIYYNPSKHFPSCFFSSHTLTSLSLDGANQLFPDSLNFPALTTLSLKNLAFRCNDDGCVEPFSTFNMLTTLILDQCLLWDNNAQNLRISSTKLLNLTIRMHFVLPRLDPRTHNFKILFGIELYTPTLHTFDFAGPDRYIPQLFASRSVLSSIKHVNINLMYSHGSGLMELREKPSILFKWLVDLANIESLTINKFSLEVLSRFPDLFKVEFPSLCNLKTLKIDSLLPAGMVDFLLQNSPSAKLEFISS